MLANRNIRRRVAGVRFSIFPWLPVGGQRHRSGSAVGRRETSVPPVIWVELLHLHDVVISVRPGRMYRLTPLQQDLPKGLCHSPGRQLAAVLCLFYRLTVGLALDGEHLIGAVLHPLPRIVVVNVEADPPAHRDNALRDAHGPLLLSGQNTAFHQLAPLTHRRDVLLAGVAEVQHVVIGSLFQVLWVDHVALPVLQRLAVHRQRH